LKVKISELEKLIQIKVKSDSEIITKGESSPIKSITFRADSKDDRIRIYWVVGRKTDLPCTKEQSIWAYG
tara:strand:+ start:127 stop:336 length:210 start_codon:yes stop_codon:yes gene_type:complete